VRVACVRVRGMVRVSFVWISERVCMCEGVHVSKSEWKDMGRAEV